MSWLSEELKFEHDWYKNLIENGNEKIVLVEFIKNSFFNSPISSFLEVGMGTHPIFASILSPSVNDYVIIEKEERNNLVLPENIQFLKNDFETVFLEKSFDLVLLSHVIYYFQNLEKSIKKAIDSLSSGGKAIFVVNGDENDYGRLKQGFAGITNTPCNFTYIKLKNILCNYKFIEYSLVSTIKFASYEELYETIRLFFDLYPMQFDMHKSEIIDWLKRNIKNNELNMDQKILVVQDNK